METTEKTASKPTLTEQVQNTGRLRIFFTAIMLLAGYAGVYMPLASRIADSERRLNKEQKHRDLTRDVEQLQVQVDAFKSRVPQRTDTNEWVQYVLGGVRGFPLKLITLDPAETQRLGPYKAVVLRIELEGPYHELDLFLNWLETNQRLFRVDTVKIEPTRAGNDTLKMQLLVLGVMA